MFMNINGIFNDINYRVTMDECDQSANDKKRPLILFLHGSGRRGDDIAMLDNYGLNKVARETAGFPFIVVAPQCPAESTWLQHRETLIGLLENIAEQFPVDWSRIYLTGFSMGGHGSWELAAYRPDLFAAVAPIAGWFDPTRASELAHVPIWNFHGDEDEIVAFQCSVDIVEAIRRLGGHVRFTAYPGLRHHFMMETYDNAELYDWFLKHSTDHANERTRVAHIRTQERLYHEQCYREHRLFEPGSWLHKPVRTVVEWLNHWSDGGHLQMLDLGSGVGRNSIPMAQYASRHGGKVVCVDLLEEALTQLLEYGNTYGVSEWLEPCLSDIETFRIAESHYDYIVAVSALEHVSSEEGLRRKLEEMARGTKPGGMNVIIISTDIEERAVTSNLSLDPLFEVNVPSATMFEWLDQTYEGWHIAERYSKKLDFQIERNGEAVLLSSDCITFVAQAPYKK